jgi:hypothetical protein
VLDQPSKQFSANWSHAQCWRKYKIPTSVAMRLTNQLHGVHNYVSRVPLQLQVQAMHIMCSAVQTCEQTVLRTCLEQVQD